MNQKRKLFSGFIALVLLSFAAPMAMAEDRPGLNADVHAAIKLLKATTPAAAELGPKARGALVFPNVTKAGFIVGALYGNGALVKAKEGGGYYIDDYYSMAAASYGFQAGVQTYGYVLMLMTDRAVQNAETSSGWDLGTGPSVVIFDAGMAKGFSVQTADADVYAFTFGQKGLMAGAGLQGTKITPLD
jgi:lipid-binding SYLF domain-containing protein